MSSLEQLYQIEVVDVSKRQRKSRQLRQGYPNHYVTPDGDKIKFADVPMPAPTKTLMMYFKNQRSAMKWGSRFGSVIACNKVDKTRYLENIEHLRLEQEPIKVTISSQIYTLNKELQVVLPNKNWNIVVDKREKH